MVCLFKFFVGGQLHSLMLRICKPKLIFPFTSFCCLQRPSDFDIIFLKITVIYSISFMISFIKSKILIYLKFNLKDGKAVNLVVSTVLVQ